MAAFRALLALVFTILVVVTAITIANHGPNLFPVFFGDIAELTWRGQFNVDFACFLVFSALWLMWRHEFSGAGLVLGVFGFFGGALFLSAYLFVMSRRVDDDVAALLLGPERARRVE